MCVCGHMQNAQNSYCEKNPRKRTFFPFRLTLQSSEPKRQNIRIRGFSSQYEFSAFFIYPPCALGVLTSETKQLLPAKNANDLLRKMKGTGNRLS